MTQGQSESAKTLPGSDTSHKVGIIGLGIMGSRMLASMNAHPDFEVRYSWDLSVARRQQVLAEFPNMQVPGSAEELMSLEDLDLVYIATPPTTHVGYAEMAMDNGKAVLLEKPMAVDLLEGRRLVEKAQSSGIPNAVNFGFATGSVYHAIRDAMDSGQLGEPVKIEMKFHFSQWPRSWQKAGRWLSGRAEGGFIREVFSHFAYLTCRLFDSPVVTSSCVVYPDDTELSETSVNTALASGSLPIHVEGRVDNSVADLTQWTLHGSGRSYRVVNWGQVQASTKTGWEDVPLGKWQGPSQLDAVSSMLKGDPHTLPDFAAGLRVQEIVESVLRN